MAALPVVKYSDYVRNIETLTNVSFTLAGLGAVIEAWRILNFDVLNVATVSQYDRNIMLQVATAFIVGLGSDLNCYPVGYTTGQLFDLDGNPVEP